MSEAELPERLTTDHRVTVDEIRALAGPSTPHFALQVRNRIRRLIEPLAADDPVRAEGERQIGAPRGPRGQQRRSPRAGRARLMTQVHS